MTDQIPAAEVRKLIAFYRDGASELEGLILDALEDLLPARPTLADMTDEERRACQWMQCDVKDVFGRVVITEPCDVDGEVGLVFEGGEIEWRSPEWVTPRPDLPRMEWPGDKKAAPALPGDWRLADHKDCGRVIVTNPTPDSLGDVYFVLPDDDCMGYDWHFCAADSLTYLDQEADQ